MNTVLTFDQIPVMVGQILEKVNRLEDLLNKPAEPHRPQRFDFSGAIDYFGKMGYTMSPSKLQKLCANKKIPCRKFNSRLIFESVELDAWVKSQTITVGDDSSVALTLSERANRKLRRG